MTPDAAPRHPDLAHHPAIDVIGAWPEDRPLAVVLAGDPAGRTTRSLIAEPVETRQTATFESAMRLINTTKTRNAATPSRTSPFGPGWLASIAYRCGSEIEPAARVTERCIQDQWPAAILARINDGWVFDNRTGRWSSFGSPAPLANPKDPGPAGFQIGEVFGLEREQAYIRAVRRAVELIHAGDAFQVNLTHRLWASFKGSPRSLFAELSRRLRPWHAVYLECPARSSQPGPTAIASFSPELFLELTPGGRVTTRPMKGTRPGDALASEFLDAEKDRAELAMIVDLMRNDLGRVCTFGSVAVDSPRQIEHHGRSITGKPELVQGVATISGQLRPGESVESLLRATFPPGSITGAPKIRAMQIIDAIEHALGYDKALPDRGPYCGSCGYIGDTGSALLNVAIRTAIISKDRIDYPVGAGIVADSDPQSEWNETLDKAKPFLDLAAHHRREAHLCRETRPGAR